MCRACRDSLCRHGRDGRPTRDGRGVDAKDVSTGGSDEWTIASPPVAAPAPPARTASVLAFYAPFAKVMRVRISSQKGRIRSHDPTKLARRLARSILRFTPLRKRAVPSALRVGLYTAHRDLDGAGGFAAHGALADRHRRPLQPRARAGGWLLRWLGERHFHANHARLVRGSGRHPGDRPRRDPWPEPHQRHAFIVAAAFAAHDGTQDRRPPIVRAS